MPQAYALDANRGEVRIDWDPLVEAVALDGARILPGATVAALIRGEHFLQVKRRNRPWQGDWIGLPPGREWLIQVGPEASVVLPWLEPESPSSPFKRSLLRLAPPMAAVSAGTTVLVGTIYGILYYNLTGMSNQYPLSSISPQERYRVLDVYSRFFLLGKLARNATLTCGTVAVLTTAVTFSGYAELPIYRNDRVRSFLRLSAADGSDIHLQAQLRW
jgi:hypothetical protein